MTLHFKRPTYPCLICGNPITPYTRDVKRWKKYCCLDCYHISKQGKAPSGMSTEESQLKAWRTKVADYNPWSKVTKDDNGCWNWTGAKNKQTGYGFTYAIGENGPIIPRRQVRVHRWAWEQINGPVPDGMVVCHQCDNKLCINPDHLFIGTSQDNTADRHTKERDARGEVQGSAKLTNEAIREMRILHSQGVSQTRLGQIYDVTQSTVSRVVLRKGWKHIE